ncbi:MAG TPA: methyltransferase domain-containing protein [Pirellulales bacterium]|nr:methyltransferase domain-containing protein [Pirellulales bacterium]
MISCPTVRKDVIRWHYDLSTLFYRLLWGRHIHHGLWEGDEPPAVAQQKLTETLAAAAAIKAEDRVLDVGCGMGGSSIYLAKRGCRVQGLTLSPLQQAWAASSARWQGVSARASFRCADAERAEFDAESFDVVWSVECTEHLFDKPTFFRQVARWLRPGGRVAICAWLAGDRLATEAQRALVYDVCEGFFCPSLGTQENYQRWMEDAGLVVDRSDLWTERVMRTWEICIQRVRWTGVGLLGRIIDRDTNMFLRRFETILTAYRTGAMQYGCFVARKPLA